MKDVSTGIQLIVLLGSFYILKFLYYIIVNFWYVFCFIALIWIIWKINDSVRNSRWYLNKKSMDFRRKYLSAYFKPEELI